MKGAKQPGVRLGNWLTAEEAKALLCAADLGAIRGKRSRAILALCLTCGLRRSESAHLAMERSIDDDASTLGSLEELNLPEALLGLLLGLVRTAQVLAGSLRHDFVPVFDLLDHAYLLKGIAFFRGRLQD